MIRSIIFGLLLLCAGDEQQILPGILNPTHVTTGTFAHYRPVTVACSLSGSSNSTNYTVMFRSETGTVNTVGTAVTSASGDQFPTWLAGNPILINGTQYTVTTVTSGTVIVLSSSAGTQTGVSWSSTPYLAGTGTGFGFSTNTNGYDINFFTSSALTTKLPWELASYSTSTGVGSWYVQVPTLFGSACSGTTTIYMAYGNSSITTDQSNKTGTWDSNYVFVQHLEGASGDSTSNAHNGTDTAITYSLANGQIVQGAGFNGSTSQISNGTTNSAFVPAQITFTAWVNYSSLQTYTSVESYEDTSDGHTLLVKSSGKLAVYISHSGGSTDYDGTGTNTLSGSTWYLIGYTYSDTTPFPLIGYVNGTVDASTTGLGGMGIPASASELIGNSFYSSRQWNGAIDEPRFSNTIRSTSWLLADYNNQSSPGTFYSVGNQI